ncbi:hypothetical protein LOD99_4239 [Oopsacas minuta]|uniref:Nucleoporin NUP42 n=1 Tax=Oopsacas minuta TaxID=111878 RepID=A0AAV7JVR9_9METZ|nr:hypothetical protein LOD99_4239 [Oopsacas minuta]
MYHSHKQKVCDYFLEGKCKYGNKCKFLHPDSSSKSHTQSGNYSNQIYTSNRYASLSQPAVATDYSKPGSFSSKILQNTSGPVTDNFQKSPFQKASSYPFNNTQQPGSVTGSDATQKLPTGLGLNETKSQSSHESYSLYDSLYSRVSDLTKEEIDAFKGQSFVMGKIPIKPPPKELCY